MTINTLTQLIYSLFLFSRITLQATYFDRFYGGDDTLLRNLTLIAIGKSNNAKSPLEVSAKEWQRAQKSVASLKYYDTDSVLSLGKVTGLEDDSVVTFEQLFQSIKEKMESLDGLDFLEKSVEVLKDNNIERIRRAQRHLYFVLYRNACPGRAANNQAYNDFLKCTEYDGESFEECIKSICKVGSGDEADGRTKALRKLTFVSKDDEGSGYNVTLAKVSIDSTISLQVNLIKTGYELGRGVLPTVSGLFFTQIHLLYH